MHRQKSQIKADRPVPETRRCPIPSWARLNPLRESMQYKSNTSIKMRRRQRELALLFAPARTNRSHPTPGLPSPPRCAGCPRRTEWGLPPFW
jgi:hypothetical protein